MLEVVEVGEEVIAMVVIVEMGGGTSGYSS